MEAILNGHPAAATQAAHKLWTRMPDTKEYPTDRGVLKLIAYYQLPYIRDRLMAGIPGINEPPEHILLAQTPQAGGKAEDPKPTNTFN